MFDYYKFNGNPLALKNRKCCVAINIGKYNHDTKKNKVYSLMFYVCAWERTLSVLSVVAYIIHL
jgi:hypothetical protein